MKYKIEKKLKRERQKLNRLVDEALENGTPIKETREIMDQCKKIKRLVLIQKLDNLLEDEDALREKLWADALYVWMEKDGGEG
ncbi:MAG: hypothetical protein PHO15_01260 [Eubacteriales bacterium]|nr:hypothetical protein [Eubacteriales bacterium]